MKLLTGLFIGLMQHLETAGATTDADFQRAMAGTLTDWRPGLPPPAAITLHAWTETYYQIPTTLAAYSKSLGRPVWGFKCPGFSRDLIRALLTLMPNAKVIYLMRDLHDALRSAKARRFVKSDEEAAAFCAQWAGNVRDMHELGRHNRILVVKYENLIEDRDAHLRLLESFTGAAGLDAKAFDVKVNTFEGEERFGLSPQQYITPMRLSLSDEAAIGAHASAMIELFYPHAEAAE